MTKCRSCNTPIEKFFDLGLMPLVNSFLKKSDISNEKRFDLSVGFCKNCYLVQLMKTVPPEKLFRKYIYLSSVSKTIVEHSKKTAEYLIKRLKLSSEGLVLEIASNDGIQLKFFKKAGIKILGVDPAKNIAKVANQKGIKTIPDFFNLSLAKKLVKKGTRADLIYGANVLAHVPKLVNFVDGVKLTLKENGTAVFEFPYLHGLLKNKFDIIYHEHVFYYSYIALQNLFNKANLEIYDVEMIPMQGGSLRIFISHPGVFKISKNVHKLLEKEKQRGFHKLSTFKIMNQNIARLKNDLITLLKKIKDEGGKIAAYGAPAKGMILLNFFGIDRKYIDFIVDKAKEKQGLYTPGTHMLVYPWEKIIQDEPNYVFILPWNIADEIMLQLKDWKKQGRKFIIPIPKIRVV